MAAEAGRSADVIVIGGGIVGCATAYFLAREGLRPLVLERTEVAAEASGANAGLIGAAGGLENDTLPFVRPSVELLFRTAEELDEPFEIQRSGRMILGFDEEDWAHQRALFERARAAGLRVELLDGPAARAAEPALGQDVLGAVHLPDDGQLDPAPATRALARAAERLGARIERGAEVGRLVASGGRIVGVETRDGLRSAPAVVLAAGAWSAHLAAGVGLALPVRPGKGQMLATSALPPFSARSFRGPMVSMSQRRSGEVIIGSTVEYVGFDKQVDPATIEAFFRSAGEALPALRSGKIGRTWAGLRPMTPDSLPIIGSAPGIDGLWLATGHSRTGMSYGPGTGRVIADLIAGRAPSLPIDRFGPDRFPANQEAAWSAALASG